MKTILNCRIQVNPYYLILTSFLLAGPVWAGSEHAFGQAAGNCGGVWRLPDTGQTLCYDGAGTVITCPVHDATLAQDGTYTPAAIQPKYTVLNPIGVSSVTVDNITGLMWVTNPNDAGFATAQTWESALTSCTVTLNGMAYGGYADWRLPNIKELQSIVDYSGQSPSINTTYFLNTQNSYYWSSTTYVPSSSDAWLVIFTSGYMYYGDKANDFYVRCVRGGP